MCLCQVFNLKFNTHTHAQRVRVRQTRAHKHSQWHSSLQQHTFGNITTLDCVINFKLICQQERRRKREWFPILGNREMHESLCYKQQQQHSLCSQKSKQSHTHTHAQADGQKFNIDIWWWWWLCRLTVHCLTALLVAGEKKLP